MLGQWKQGCTHWSSSLFSDMFSTCVDACCVHESGGSGQVQVLSDFGRIGTPHFWLLRRRSLSSWMLQTGFTSVIFFHIGKVDACPSELQASLENELYQKLLCRVASISVAMSPGYYTYAKILDCISIIHWIFIFANYYFCPCGQYGLVLFLWMPREFHNCWRYATLNN